MQSEYSLHGNSERAARCFQRLVCEKRLDNGKLFNIINKDLETHLDCIESGKWRRWTRTTCFLQRMLRLPNEDRCCAQLLPSLGPWQVHYHNNHLNINNIIRIYCLHNIFYFLCLKMEIAFEYNKLHANICMCVNFCTVGQMNAYNPFSLIQ